MKIYRSTSCTSAAIVYTRMIIMTSFDRGCDEFMTERKQRWWRGPRAGWREEDRDPREMLETAEVGKGSGRRMVDDCVEIHSRLLFQKHLAWLSSQ